MFNTRFILVNSGTGLAGVVVYEKTAIGGLETFRGNYEENDMLKAEARTFLNDFSGAATIINAGTRVTRG